MVRVPLDYVKTKGQKINVALAQGCTCVLLLDTFECQLLLGLLPDRDRKRCFTRSVTAYHLTWQGPITLSLLAGKEALWVFHTLGFSWWLLILSLSLSLFIALTTPSNSCPVLELFQFLHFLYLLNPWNATLASTFPFMMNLSSCTCTAVARWGLCAPCDMVLVPSHSVISS